MSLNKKEKEFPSGLVRLGFCSSMIVRYALKHKEIQISGRPGNYESNTSASSQNIILAPEDAQNTNGIVVYHEFNQSVRRTLLHPTVGSSRLLVNLDRKDYSF